MATFSCSPHSFFLLATLHGGWDLSSMTRDRNQALLHWECGVLTTGPPGKALLAVLVRTFLSAHALELSSFSAHMVILDLISSWWSHLTLITSFKALSSNSHIEDLILYIFWGGTQFSPEKQVICFTSCLGPTRRKEHQIKLLKEITESFTFPYLLAPLFPFLSAVLYSLQDLSSPTRDGTPASAERMRSPNH